MSQSSPAHRPSSRIQRVTRPFVEFSRLQTASGIILLMCAAVAFAWANSPWAESYRALWELPIGFSGGAASFRFPLLLVINDGLMTLFFFVVGLEIKRELLRGELSTRQKAFLPIAAAIGGMIVPALIYLSFNGGTAASVGWGVPVATDIAFSLGVLSLVGGTVPFALKVFLTAFAIVDDLGAVVVIAIFYTSAIILPSLALVALLFGAMLVLSRAGVRRAWPYIFLAVTLWAAMLSSGVHATIAGVLAAFAIPMDSAEKREGRSLLESMEHALHPWVTFGVMPVFAIANAGVTVEGDIATALLNPVTLGIALGLIVGKFIGLLLTSWSTVRLGLAALPRDSGWQHMAAVSILGGVGFTMSLFIANLAFDGTPFLPEAKIGILTGSMIAGIAGWITLRRITRRHSSSI